MNLEAEGCKTTQITDYTDWVLVFLHNDLYVLLLSSYKNLFLLYSDQKVCFVCACQSWLLLTPSHINFFGLECFVIGMHLFNF
jgi:hypothetical protein